MVTGDANAPREPTDQPPIVPTRARRALVFLVFVLLVVGDLEGAVAVEFATRHGQALNGFMLQPCLQAVTAFLYRPSQVPFMGRWFLAAIAGTLLLMFLAMFY
jgi:hypothetical protein